VLGKFLLGILSVTLVMPALLFSRPQKAEALVSLAQCFAAKGVATGTALAKVAPGLVTSVSVVNPSQTQVTAEGAAGTDWASCFMKSMTKIIAKTLLHTFTQSIVNWINTGFEGSPSFITNPEGFLSDVADQTIGKVIQDISPLLCAPFKLNIKFALGLNIGLRTKETVTCRLSDVIENVQGAYDSFVSGTVGSGNLSRWVHIAGTQSNNPYGAYIGATSVMSASITTATGQQIKLLDWGKGFKSWRSCEKWGPNVKDAQGRVTRNGPCIKEGPIKTPGSVIESQTTGALATTFRELELANEIDEVVGALINQLLTKVMTAGGGLLGASKGSITSGGRSATDALATDPTKVVANANAKTPPGIDCRLRYYPATKETFTGSGFYVPNDANDSAGVGRQVWTDRLGNETQAELDLMNDDEKNGLYKKARNKNLAFAPIMRPANQTWEAYFAQIKAGCNNEWNSLIDDAAARGRGVYSADTDGVSGATKPPPPTTQTVSGNIAANKKAYQSSIYNGGCYRGWDALQTSPGPQHAVDGNKVGALDSGIALTSCGSNDWWMVDLATEDMLYAQSSGIGPIIIDEIREIKIYGATSPYFGWFSLYGATAPFKVYVTTTDPRSTENPNYLSTIDQFESNPATVVYKGSHYLDSAGNFNDRLVPSITLPAGTKGRYVVIMKDYTKIYGSYDKMLGIAEVEVIGKQTRGDSSGGSPTVVPFSFAASPAQQTFRKPADWAPGTQFIWGPLFFTPNQQRGGITFRARYFAKCSPETAAANCIDGYKREPETLTNWLNSLNLLYRIDGESKRKDMIDERGEYTADADVPDGANAIFFVKDLSLLNTRPIEITLEGSQRCESVSCSGVPFRLVIDALTDAGTQKATSVGSVKADFTVQ